VVEQKPVTVCVQSATLSLQEGTNSEGKPYRVATVTFTGRDGGPALLTLGGPTAELDLVTMDTLIASME
jgi:hypothetical protein